MSNDVIDEVIAKIKADEAQLGADVVKVKAWYEHWQVYLIGACFFVFGMLLGHKL